MEQKTMDIATTDKTLPEFRNHDRSVGLRARLDGAIERAMEERRIVGTVVLVAEGGDVLPLQITTSRRRKEGEDVGG